MTDDKTDGNSPALYEAARAYVRAAMELAKERYPEQSASIRTSEWVRWTPTAFIMRERNIPYWFAWLAPCRYEMTARSEYSRLVAALQSDATVASRLGKMVGPPSMKVGIDADSMISALVYRSVEMCGSLRFDEALFDQAFRELDADLHRSEFYFIFVTPLFGLKAESLPLGLAPTIEIDRLSELEIVRCLSVGLWPASMHAVGAGIADVGSGIGVRIRVEASTQFAETPKDESNGAIQLEQMREQVQDVIHALRLFKEGQVSMPGHAMFSEQWPDAGTLKLPNPGSTLTACYYELKAEEAVEFKHF